MTVALPLDHRQALWATGAAAFVSAFAFLCPSFLPALPAMALSFFDALPLLVCGLLYGWVYGLWAGTLGALMVAVVQASGLSLPETPVVSLSLLFFVENALPAAFFVHIAYVLPAYLRTHPVPIPLPVPVLVQGAVTGSMTLYAMVLAVAMTFLLDTEAVRAVMDQTLAALQQADPDAIKVLQQTWGQDLPDQLVAAMPGLSALGWLLGFLVNLVVSVRIWSKMIHKPTPVIKMAWFRLPRWLVGVVFVLGLLLMLHTRHVVVFPDGVFSLLNNILLVALAGFFLNGAGVFHHMATGQRRFIIPLFYMAFFFIPLLIYVVAMVGLMDPIVSMRRDLYPTVKG